MSNLCNCGEPIRYSHKEGGSCNKYFICPTYEQLRKEHHTYRKLSQMYFNTLTNIRDVETNGYEYRTWAKNAIVLGESWDD